MTRPYSHEFFGSQAHTAADRIVSIVHDWLRPSSVLDVGCGLGVWLHAWERLGCGVLGLDGDYIDRNKLHIAPQDFVATRLDQPFDVQRRFDLTMSLEVAEHLDESCAEQFVDDLGRHSDVVLFSAAIPGQGGEHHVNCQWPSYWSSKFEARGFRTFDVLRSRIWNDDDIVWWYRQNIMLFAREEPARVLASLDLVPAPFDLVHPQWYLDRTAETSLRSHTANWIDAAKRAAVRRLPRSRAHLP